jgi:cation diffusion facilitator CzcD-associated flavoprotein CzcO
VTAAEAGPATQTPADLISCPETRPVLVIGGGPAGLAVAACLGEFGIAADLVDRRGAPGGAFLDIPPETRLLSLASHLGLPGLPIVTGSPYATAGAYRAYLDRYAEHHRLAPRSCVVRSVERRGERFEVVSDREPQVRYAAIVVATGIFDHPVVPEIPGLAAPGTGPTVIHAREYSLVKARAARRVLVLGAGVSAVQIAEGCAMSGIPVTLSSRRPVRTYPQRFLGVDLNNLAYHLSAWLPENVLCRTRRGASSLPGVDGGFRRLRRAGRIDVRGPVEEVTPRGAVFSDGAAEEFDLIVLATGYRYWTPFLPPEVERMRDGRPRVAGAESVSWPGLFFAGLECSLRLSGGTLRGIAKDAPILAARAAAHIRALGAETGR